MSHLESGPLLLSRAHGAAQTTAIAVYSLSVSALFGFSALYHRGTWTVAWRQRLQRLDHAMIFFLIAGTATPAFVLAARGAFGLTCLIALWALTVITAAIHLVSALTIKRDLTAFVCYDRPLLDAAEVVGLPVVSPS